MYKQVDKGDRRLKVEYYNHNKKYTRTQAYKDFPHLKEDVEKELKDFKKSDCLNTKLSYLDGLGVWMERTLDEVKGANKGFQERTEQIERPPKKKTIQKPCY